MGRCGAKGGEVGRSDNKEGENRVKDNKYDSKGKCNKMGEEAEEAELRFDEVITSLNGASKASSENETKFDHIDRVVQLNKSKEFSVDVKALKSTKRGGAKDVSRIWVEFKGISGHDGWLYGKANYIAFEVADYDFVLVSRKRLLKFCVDKVKRGEDDIVNQSDKALYVGYRRSQMPKELTSQILLSDVRNMPHVKLRKGEMLQINQDRKSRVAKAAQVKEVLKAQAEAQAEAPKVSKAPESKTFDSYMDEFVY